MVDHDANLTLMLRAVSDGQTGAVARLMPLVYERLRTMARRELDSERAGHTLQPTALVHEAFLKLVGQGANFRDHAHFLAVASQAMRRILVDHARARGRSKRRGRARVPLTGLETPESVVELDLLDLDESIERLRVIDPEGAQVVEMRFFAGMEEREIAEVLSVSERTVRRYWIHAKAWLTRELIAVDQQPEDGGQENRA